MKHTLLLLIVFTMNTFIFFSQENIRECVVIVRPSYSDKTNEFLKKFSERMKKDGYFMISENLRMLYLGKGFGSGFIIKGNDGNMYVLTNQHVVKQAESVNIEFSNTDGSSVNYTKCNIIMTDIDNDLALIAFPKNADIQHYLNFSLKNAEDGQEVYSAGFPSVKGNPSWQLGKGIISNANFSMDLLNETITSNVIQHTAQIDYGSSGGPLLIKDQNEINGYSVIGLNTWKVFSRENMNLTIPITTIIEFINKATLSVYNINNSINLEKESREFTTNALHGYKRILKYISYNYIENLDFESFYSYMNNSTKEAQKEVFSQLSNNQPFEAIRIVLADAIIQNIERNKNIFSFSNISDLTSIESRNNVTFLLNQKPVNSEWIIEQNQWKINHFSILKAYNEKTLRKAQDYTYYLKLTPQLYISTNKAEKNGYGIDASVGENWFVGMGLFKYSHRAGYVDFYNSTSTENDIIEIGYANYTQLTLNAGYQYPLQFSKLYIIPFIKGSYGVNFGSFFSFTNQLSGGLQTGYKLKNDKIVLFHLEIAPRKINNVNIWEFNSGNFNTLLDTNMRFWGFNVGFSYCI